MYRRGKVTRHIGSAHDKGSHLENREVREVCLAHYLEMDELNQ